MIIHLAGIIPPGHRLVRGVDSLGSTRLWLYADAPAGGKLRGSIVLPRYGRGQAVAYGPSGGYVRAGYDTTALLTELADPKDPR